MSKHHCGLGSKDRRFIKDALVNRYGWTCHLCLDVIERQPSDPLMALSVDHLIPISRRKSWELENLRPAHIRCNTQRGQLAG